MASRKVAQFVTKKILRIDPDEHLRRQPRDLLEKRAKEAIGSTYLEKEPSVGEWLRELVPSKEGAAQYFNDLFPSATWLRRYNLRWLLGDVIAGLTIGIVIIPQAMAYALLARLTPEFGLYTSFTGAVVYWLFGTSKDIVIGTTAVGSLLVGTVVTKVENQRPGVYQKEDVAKALSLLAGAILFVLGICRMGWVIEFIPYVPISAFVTAASVTIMSTQLPVALGITGINTREAPYRVLINTMKGLPRTKLDASIGLTSIALLFFIKYVCATMEVRQPSRKRMWATLSSLRLSFAMILFTFISWLVHRNMPKGQSKFRLVGVIERGFRHAGVPTLHRDLLTIITPELPAVVIILIIEHIAIAKSFGRVFGYTVITSQEMCAQGAANLFSPFVGGYVCTGSFSASAVLSKAGVRTPLAGMFSALILILALYALTSVFYYIPLPALAGLIIHAVSNLATPPWILYKYWRLSPFELLIWATGVVLALFMSLETSIYTMICLSFVLVLVRLARTKGRILGSVRIYRGVSDGSQDKPDETNSSPHVEAAMLSRDAFLPIDRNDSSNPNVEVKSPYPGIFIYQFSEGFNYLNQGQQMDSLLGYIMKNTRRTKVEDGINPKDRLWCDADSLPGHEQGGGTLPLLRAVVLNCATVNNVDITCVQGLVDLRNILDRHAAPSTVDWHFAGVMNRWTRRALAQCGFGYPAAHSLDRLGNWSMVYTVAGSLAPTSDDEEKCSPPECAEILNDAMIESVVNDGGFLGDDGNGAIKPSNKRFESVYGIDRPFFHIDLVDAVNAAVRDAKKKAAKM